MEIQGVPKIGISSVVHSKHIDPDCIDVVDNDIGRCVKMRTFFFLSTKPRLSQAGALLLPKDFVSLGIRFSL